APAAYMEPAETNSGDFIWTLRTFTSYAYSPVSGVIELDAKYDGIANGTQLLISEPGSHHLVTVTSVKQGQSKFVAASDSTITPVQDTVTQVTVTPSLTISDRRNVVIHELKGSQIRFWGYRYGDAVDGQTVYIPARRLDAQTAEIGCVIQNN